MADDHIVLRQGLKRLLEEGSDLKVVGEARNGIELLELVDKVKPDMVILDVSMPNLDGIEAADKKDEDKSFEQGKDEDKKKLE